MIKKNHEARNDRCVANFWLKVYYPLDEYNDLFLQDSK